jgi:hypothetical protein
MKENSSKQIDAVWILHEGSSKKCYLEDIFSKFEALIGPKMGRTTTILITQCDAVMQKGDYL